MKHAFDVQYPLAGYLTGYDPPFTIAEVATWMGCSYMTARRRMKELGVKLKYAGKRRGGRGAPPSVYRRVK